MSRHHSTLSNRVQDLVKQVNDTDPSEWKVVFDIDVDTSGNLWDLLENNCFPSVLEWAEFQIQLDSQDEDNRNYGYRFDDE